MITLDGHCLLHNIAIHTHARFLHQLVTVVSAMKLLLLFIIGMYSAHCALTDAEITQQWNDFKVKFNKKYADDAEEQMRKQLFTTNLQKIEEHNKKYERGEVTYTQGINQFADLTDEELKPYSHGVLRPKQN
jgi:hypothetical protein